MRLGRVVGTRNARCSAAGKQIARHQGRRFIDHADIGSAAGMTSPKLARGGSHALTSHTETKVSAPACHGKAHPAGAKGRASPPHLTQQTPRAIDALLSVPRDIRKEHNDQRCSSSRDTLSRVVLSLEWFQCKVLKLNSLVRFYFSSLSSVGSLLFLDRSRARD